MNCLRHFSDGIGICISCKKPVKGGGIEMTEKLEPQICTITGCKQYSKKHQDNCRKMRPEFCKEPEYICSDGVCGHINWNYPDHCDVDVCIKSVGTVEQNGANK